MSPPFTSLRIRGVHSVVPSQPELDEALEVQWGRGLKGRALEAARRSVREHFDSLFLIEVQILPPPVELDWSEFTQRQSDQSQSNWQVAYDEQCVDQSDGRWAFFLHFVNFQQPLTTPFSDYSLPQPTPLPNHLAHLRYEVP